MAEWLYVTVCFFGDGASDKGSFHEALNMASLWNLPVICARVLTGEDLAVDFAPRVFSR
jgi:hypothetical protein